MPVVFSTPYKVIPASWETITQGDDFVTNTAFSSRGILQNVGNGKILGFYADQTNPQGASAQSYTLSGTTVNIDASLLDFHTGGSISGYYIDMAKVDTDKAIITYQSPTSSTTGVVRILSTGSGSITAGAIHTYSNNSYHVVTALTTTEAVTGVNQFSGSAFVQLKKINISGTNVSTAYTTSIGSNTIQPYLQRFDDTHVTATIRNTSPDRWELRVYNMGVSSFSQVGSTVTATEFNSSYPVRFIRLRDDGDGIVYAMVQYAPIGPIARVMAFKVANGTYAITKGSSLNLSSAADNSGFSRPITRLTDNSFMTTSQNRVYIIEVDGSLNCSEFSADAITSGIHCEVEAFDSENALRRRPSFGTLFYAG